MEEIFMLYLHIHKAQHFTFKILFHHNISAQLKSTLDFSRITLHLFVSNTENKVFSSFQTKIRMKLFCHPQGMQRLPYRSEGNRWDSPCNMTTSSLIYPCRKSLSNIKPLFYWNQRQWWTLSLSKRKSAFQLWTDGAPKRLYLSKQLCGFSTQLS